jgi:acetylornithine deacetylase/succinyl-diaminopimelate desuccinylase-like protein
MTVPGLRPEVGAIWERDVLPTLSEYVSIRCLSPAFDPDWQAHGELDRAAVLLRQWCLDLGVRNTDAQIVSLEGRTPLLFVEIDADPGIGPRGPRTQPASLEGGVFVYGHLDKQPPLGDWADGLDPFSAVRRGDRLYGRGTADDGYAVFAALSALLALQEAGRPRPRCTVLIEASEESASPDLEAYLEHLAARIGRPQVVVCLDSGAPTYDRLWSTSSLRGALAMTLRVDVLRHGAHSGLLGGVVPSSFRILRQLLSRVEDPRTGEILLPELQAEVPARHRAEAAAVAALLGDSVFDDVPAVQGLVFDATTPEELLLRKAWAPAMAVIGIDGVPTPGSAGNVLRPYTAARLSFRLPPSCDAQRAAGALVEAFTTNPPSGAAVSVTVEAPAPGWVAPELEPWLDQIVDEASTSNFGAPSGSWGEGGSIPFLAALGARFPDAQIVATGVLGPKSNAHGPDESLHLPTAVALSSSLAHIIASTDANRQHAPRGEAR